MLATTSSTALAATTRLNGGAGNDRLDGGAGTDVAVFAGTRRTTLSVQRHHEPTDVTT